MVNAGGTLAGTGVVSGVIVNSNGTVAPGLSIGTLTVTTWDQTGALEIEVAGRESSQIRATGTATINPGALVTVDLQGSHFQGDSYLFFHASAPIVDPTNWILQLPPGSDFTLQLSPDGTQAFFGVNNTVLFPTKQVDPGNPTAVVDYLRCLNIQLSETEFVEAVLAVESLTDQEFNAALNQLHPGLFGAFNLANLDNNALILATIERQFTDFPCSRRFCSQKEKDCTADQEKNDFWVSPLANFTNVDKYQQLRGYHTLGGGVVVGYDHYSQDHTITGVGAGYLYTDLKWNQSAGKADIHKVFGALYFGYLVRHFTFDFALMGGGNFYGVDRKISFVDVNRTATNHHTSYFITPHLGMKGIFDANVVLFEIFGSLDYFYLHEPSYKENGAGIFDLQVRKKNWHALRSDLGLTVAKDFELSRGCLRIFMSPSWVWKIPLGSDQYKSKLRSAIGKPCTLVVETFDKSKHFLAVDLGAAYKTRFLIFSAVYRGEYHGQYLVNQVEAKLKRLF